MENPFADLIPAQQNQAANVNPFSDLIPSNSESANGLTPVDAAKSLATWAGRNVVKGFGRGLVEDWQGAKQLGMRAGEWAGLLPQGGADQYTKTTDAERAAYNAANTGENFPGEGIGRIAGQTAPYMLIPGGIGGSLLRRAGTGLLSGMATGASQYVPEGGSRGFNTALGGLLGGTIPNLMAGGSKIFNATKGGTESPVQQAVIQAGEKANVPVFAADVSNSPAIRGISTALEDVPIIGMRGKRAEQMQAAQGAAQNTVNNLSDAMLSTPFGGRTGQRVIEKVANSDGARSKVANTLLQDMQNAGDDWNRIAQTSQNVQLFRAKLIADRKYNHLEQVADQYGTLDTSKILRKVNGYIKNEEKAVLKNEGLLSTLNKIKDGLLEVAPATAASTILDASGNPAISAIQKSVNPRALKYSELRKFRSDLSDVISDYFSGANAAIGKKGVGVLEGLKGQIDGTLDNFAQSKDANLRSLWQNANHFYQTAVAPAKDKLLAKSLTDADPDTIYSKWIMQGDKKDRATRFYQSLDNKGRAAVRYGMVNHALESAMKEQGEGMFSPGRMAAELEKIRGARGAFFTGSDRAEMDGFTNLMRHIDRSYQAVNKPDTGVKNVPYLIAALVGGAGVMAPGATAAGVAGVGALKLLMTTKAGRNLLLASSRLNAGTPQMQKVLDNTTKFLQRAGVVAGVNAAQPESKTTAQ